MVGMNLRQEMGVDKDPEFDLELPPGWARHAVSDEQRDATIRDLRTRLKSAGMLGRSAEIESAFQSAFDEMRGSGVFAYFSASDPGENTLAIPASISASIRTGEPGRTLDDVVRDLVRAYGATPLWGDPRTISCERERNQSVGGETLVAHSRIYLTPVPGSKRRRALQLVANFARPVDVDSDAERIREVRGMFDACVASLRWQR